MLASKLQRFFLLLVMVQDTQPPEGDGSWRKCISDLALSGWWVIWKQRYSRSTAPTSCEQQVQHLICLLFKTWRLILIKEVSREKWAFANPAYIGELGPPEQGKWDDNLSTGMANGLICRKGMRCCCEDGEGCSGLLTVMTCDNTRI